MDILAAMRIFVRVVECGNLSMAARDLGVGQPTVSERIAKLEAYLGERLLHRSTRSVRPTDIGLLFFERSKKAIEAALFAEGVSLRSEGALRGTVRIAAPHGLGERVLPQILMRFRKIHPHVNIDLILNDRFVSPASEGVDISIRLGDQAEAGYVDEEIGFVPRALVASAAYLAEYGAPSTVEDLAAHPFMRVDGIFDDDCLLLLHGGERVRVPVSTAWTVSNWRPLHALLLAGAGIGVLQVPACAEALAAGQLKRILPQYEVPGFRLRLLYERREPPSEITTQLVPFLKEELQFLRGDGPVVRA